MGPLLERVGVRTLRGFDAAHLEPRPDLVVIGNVCRSDNPEARAAIDGGIPYTHIAGALERFVLPHTKPLVVAGTHGKTTTTSLAAWLLEGSGRRPGFLIGGVASNFEKSFRAPLRGRLPLADGNAGEVPFVIEGDEYDTAFFEKTAKFLHYRAKVAIITSIEHDHVDIYPTMDSYVAAFREFVARVPESGKIVANANDALVVEVVRQARADVAFYALEGASTHGVAPRWLAAPAVTAEGGTSFDLYAGGVMCGRFVVPLAGRHNVANATAAMAAVVEGYGAKLPELVRPLSEFRGVERRQQVIGRPRGVVVIDDFAHHPTAVKETLAALAARFPGGRLFAVFEPRSATACRAIHQEAYAESFGTAAEVLLAPIGRLNLKPEERLDLGRLTADLSRRGQHAEAFADVDSIVQRLVERTRPGDVVALLSNGAFGGIHEKLLAALAIG
jgi:UDP-N-acetylmuramate: L-alanyl-gamma-D-glutamyl-meso-diaminopimelate ligase